MFFNGKECNQEFQISILWATSAKIKQCVEEYPAAKLTSAFQYFVLAMFLMERTSFSHGKKVLSTVTWDSQGQCSKPTTVKFKTFSELYVRFDVFTSVNMVRSIFWYIPSCSAVKVYRCFGEIFLSSSVAKSKPRRNWYEADSKDKGNIFLLNGGSIYIPEDIPLKARTHC